MEWILTELTSQDRNQGFLPDNRPWINHVINNVIICERLYLI